MASSGHDAELEEVITLPEEDTFEGSDYKVPKNSNEPITHAKTSSAKSQIPVPKNSNVKAPTQSNNMKKTELPPNAKKRKVFIPRKKKEWSPYRFSWTETPFLCCLKPILRHWIKLRQFILRNPIFSARVPFPCWRKLDRAFTIGEVVVYFAALGALIIYCALCFVGSKCSELTSGSVANMMASLTFMLACRGSLLTLLLGIPFERALLWHKLTAVATVAIGWVHGIRIVQEEKDATPETGYSYAGFLTAMIVTSIVWVRRHCFNWFHFFHVLLAVGIFVSGVAHALKVQSIQPSFFMGIAVWAIDLIIRHFILTLLRNPHKATVTRLPAKIVRVSFPRNELEFSAGQYFFLMIPEINVFEWHPFSASSSPHQDHVEFHIRVLGNWTRSLYWLCVENGGPTEMNVYFDGPYGSPEVDVDGGKYKLFLLVSGGIGITPLQSICNHLLHEHEENGRPMKKIWFVWTVADKYMVSSSIEEERRWGDETGFNPVGKSTRLPLTFQPDGLTRISSGIPARTKKATKMRRMKELKGWKDENVLHTEFFLTRARSPKDFGKANIWPHLQEHLKFGRPDLPEILRTMIDIAEKSGESRIAVFCCGPGPLVDTVRTLCGKYSGSCGGVSFDFHSELFEF